jgi:DNA-binding MarR family transcriptional regulator
MPHLMLKNLPRHECLLDAAQKFPDLDPSATAVFLHVLRAGDEAFRVVESHLAEFGITHGRFGVLMALWGNCQREGSETPLTPAEIAERTGVTRATITGLIDSLERARLVARTPHPGDRRMTSVALTARGEKLLQKIMPAHFRQMAWLLGPLSEGERRTLIRLLTKLLGRAAERPADAPAHAEPAAAGR